MCFHHIFLLVFLSLFLHAYTAIIVNQARKAMNDLVASIANLDRAVKHRKKDLLRRNIQNCLVCCCGMSCQVSKPEKVCLEGDGKQSQKRTACESNPCPSGQSYIPSDNPPFYKCDECPAGSMLNGTTCVVLDECELARPWFPNMQCTNLRPGLKCGPCPPGFTGNGTQGVEMDSALKNRQYCNDIDECAVGNGGCLPNTQCTNMNGSFVCGPCDDGFEGNQITGCTEIGIGFCSDDSECAEYWRCVLSDDDGEDICECTVGKYDSGTYQCPPDEDLDGLPDFHLNCSESWCKKDTCLTVANPGQENLDGDGTGDVCDPDADDDGILNEDDNCPLVYNPNQEDLCPTDPNLDQDHSFYVLKYQLIHESNIANYERLT